MRAHTRPIAGSRPRLWRGARAPGESRVDNPPADHRDQFGPGYRVIAALGFLIFAASLSAADPYTSTGFLKFPAEVEVGAMSADAIDSADRIYVLHPGEPPLVSFDADGKFIRGWGQGLFKVPHGLPANRAGNVWTTDNGN